MSKPREKRTYASTMLRVKEQPLWLWCVLLVAILISRLMGVFGVDSAGMAKMYNICLISGSITNGWILIYSYVKDMVDWID